MGWSHSSRYSWQIATTVHTSYGLLTHHWLLKLVHKIPLHVKEKSVTQVKIKISKMRRVPSASSLTENTIRRTGKYHISGSGKHRIRYVRVTLYKKTSVHTHLISSTYFNTFARNKNISIILKFLQLLERHWVIKMLNTSKFRGEHQKNALKRFSAFACDTFVPRFGLHFGLQYL